MPTVGMKRYDYSKAWEAVFWGIGIRRKRG
ncbi:hypothetical protein MPLA_320029 [Mesorhizobium sp. ORS 3359]|nr:hypothetical protein MPLA_320029 [Mesorhizobium sp. ORS 3359]